MRSNYVFTNRLKQSLPSPFPPESFCLPIWSQSDFCVIAMKICLHPLTGTSAGGQRYLAQGFISKQRLKLEGWAVSTADILHMNAALGM